MTKGEKGWMRVGQFPTRELAQKRLSSITAHCTISKGFDFRITKDTKGSAWGTPHVTYRLWAKDQNRRK